MDRSDESVLLSTAYFAPVRYFTKFVIYPKVIIELEESYYKQSYRNRCYIAAANGRLPLVIPVKKKYGTHTKTKDIEIDYDTNWQKIHWNSIESAYKSSPFFEFYEDDLIRFYQYREKFLIDLNNKSTDIILKYLDIEISVEYTSEYKPAYPDNVDDLRMNIHPKRRYNKPDNSFYPEPYTQVFEEKFDFISNLSIIDLLFNEGPQANTILLNSIKKKGQL
jgi:hypothetical protein